MKGSKTSKGKTQQVSEIRPATRIKDKAIILVLSGTKMERISLIVKEPITRMHTPFSRQAKRECRQKKIKDLARMKLSK